MYKYPGSPAYICAKEGRRNTLLPPIQSLGWVEGIRSDGLWGSPRLGEFQDLFQLADEEDLLLAVGEGPELEQRPQHRLRQLRVLLHELCQASNMNQLQQRAVCRAFAVVRSPTHHQQLDPLCYGISRPAASVLRMCLTDCMLVAR